MSPLRPSQPAGPRRFAVAVAMILALASALTACSWARGRAAESPSAPTTHLAAPVPVPAGGTPSTPSSAARPLILDARWVERSGIRALRVVPSTSGRRAAPADVWQELRRRVPEADSPGMQDQLWCHQMFATDKGSWNLEPGRPVVSAADMVRARCNPGRLADPDIR